MRTLIIAGIHNFTRWIEPTLAQYKKLLQYDEVVFVGDYFDDFGDNEFIASGTAHWLKQSLEHKDRIHLLGNHDMPYFVGSTTSGCYCPGYNLAKDKAINRVLDLEHWEKLKPAYFTQGWLISHAGFHPDLFHCPVNGLYTPEQLIEKATEGLNQVKAGLEHYAFQSGHRMGQARIGGITWADWDDEFFPYDGVNQIVGHTPAKAVRELSPEKSRNYCVDVGNKILTLIIDGEPFFFKNNLLV